MFKGRPCSGQYHHLLAIFGSAAMISPPPPRTPPKLVKLQNTPGDLWLNKAVKISWPHCDKENKKVKKECYVQGNEFIPDISKYNI